MTRVSVIVPAYNAARYLPAAIDSVVGQTYSDWELIVVDDGSSDETHSLVQSYRPSLGEKLLYIYQSNRGLPAARNTGIRQAQGEFIAILDADDVWLPTRLARGIAVMDHCPQVALVHSRAARINVHGDIVGYLDFPRENQAGRIAVKLYDRRASICCPTVLLRKKCLDVTGLFDETMRATEDRDLWFRIAEHYEIAYIDETLAHLRLTPGSMSSDPGRMLKWQLFFVRKHYARRACGRTALLRALGQIYREQGDFFFSRGELSRSIGYYSLSVLCNPLRIKNVYMLFRAGAEPLLSGIRTMRMPRSIKGKLG